MADGSKREQPGGPLHLLKNKRWQRETARCYALRDAEVIHDAVKGFVLVATADVSAGHFFIVEQGLSAGLDPDKTSYIHPRDWQEVPPCVYGFPFWLLPASALRYQPSLLPYLRKSLAGTERFYGLSSFCSHSCCANCLRITREDGLSAIVSCVPMKAGEEVTLSYMPAASKPGRSRWISRAMLFWRFGFICQCRRCTDTTGCTSKEAEELDIRRSMLETEASLVQEGIDEVLEQATVKDFDSVDRGVDIAIWRARHDGIDQFLKVAGATQLMILVPIVWLLWPWLRVVLETLALRCALAAVVAVFYRTVNDEAALNPAQQPEPGAFHHTSASALAPVTTAITSLLVAVWSSYWFDSVNQVLVVGSTVALGEWSLTFRTRRSLSLLTPLQMLGCKAVLTWALADYWPTIAFAWSAAFLYGLTVEELEHDPEAAKTLNKVLPSRMHIESSARAVRSLGKL
eukprot:TRINITY_DN69458_c0_g1_i1.p1 TRINITY_DN69458_c0_g1~~TRINITY_DN69458_c0_g1_i1.p1  ORF type:complete len:459 (+),score=76.68 TRINITY_DN69458_c0_g1_i1:59-1435(+)